MMRRIATVATAFGFGAVVALLFHFAPGLSNAVPVTATTIHPAWIETKWPFLMDEWGTGKAFQCKAADCGVELNLYIRSKIGFCSATTGVADDNELARLSDFDFMDGDVVALGDGREINVAQMKGRMRAYTFAGRDRLRTSAITVAFNSNSDALVATVVLNNAQPTVVEPAVIEFLSGKTIQRWVMLTLGL
jgi:hypothetical protein